MSSLLRPYQQQMVDEARQRLREGFRAPCVVSPCGSGKSVVIAEIARLTKGRVLFLVHRRELKEQIRSTFEYWGVNMDKVEIGMVQTIARRLDKTIPPSLIITDETHHSMAGSYRKIYDHFPDAFRLGFTATPTRLDGSGLDDVYDVLVEGPSVEWLIANEHLAPYAIFAPPVALDRKKLKKARGDFTVKSIEKNWTKAIYGDVIKHYRQHADGAKAIAYLPSVKLSQETAEMFNQEGIPAAHIDGTTPKAERDAIIESFRVGDVRILCNVDIVGEGFDVPDCEVSILLRPTQSLGLYIQQAMRCMRYLPGKQAIILDHVGNCLEHGLPDDEREWSLKAGPKKARDDGDEFAVVTCSECFCVFARAGSGLVCPNCGHVNEGEEREIDYLPDVDLVNVTDETFTVNTMEPNDCKSMNDLYALAKARGYKPGWAWHQGKARGWVR